MKAIRSAREKLGRQPALFGIWVAVLVLRVSVLAFDLYLVAARGVYRQTPGGYTDHWWPLLIFTAIDAMIVWKVLHLRTCVAYVLGALLLLAIVTGNISSIAANGAAFIGYVLVLRAARKRISLTACT